MEMYDSTASITSSDLFLWFLCNSRKAHEGSKVPVVCLERLKILVSRCPPQGHHSTTPSAESKMKCEGIVSQELDRELGAEVSSTNSSISFIQVSLFKKLDLCVDVCGFIKGGTW